MCDGASPTSSARDDHSRRSLRSRSRCGRAAGLRLREEGRLQLVLVAIPLSAFFSLIVGIRMLLKGQAPIVVTQNNRLLQSSDATDDAAHRTLRAVHEPLPSAVRLARLDRQQRGLVVQSSFAASAVEAREAGGCIDAGYPISSRNRVATYRGGRSVSCWAALARTITHMPLINRGCRSARRRLAGRSHATRRRHHQCADPAGGVRCPYRVRPKQLRSRRR